MHLKCVSSIEEKGLIGAVLSQMQYPIIIIIIL
jgi:hypothetical protein